MLGYQFADLHLLQEALTHASGADHRLTSNERLEFLGDAILGAIVCDLLFRKFPEYLEGELTKIKSIVVSRHTCAKISQDLGIDEFLVMGKGMGSRSQTPVSMLADVFESLIGAIYLDGGMEAARAFVVRHIEPEIDAAVDVGNGLNYKSNLQQFASASMARLRRIFCSMKRGRITRNASRFRRGSASGGTLRPGAERRKRPSSALALNALCQVAGDPLPHASD